MLRFFASIGFPLLKKPMTEEIDIKPNFFLDIVALFVGGYRENACYFNPEIGQKYVFPGIDYEQAKTKAEIFNCFVDLMKKEETVSIWYKSTTSNLVDIPF